jgi:alkylation response protein AidB-like acyl-CoA dehydrogenase
VRLDLARTHAQLSAMSLLNWRMACAVSDGTLTPADASSVKVFGTELSCEAYQLLAEVLGQAAVLRKGSPGAVLAGRIERGMQGALILTFGGGVNEVQRDLISVFGLGMPMVKR